MSTLFEAPVFNVESALKAAKSGVDRLELCSSFHSGGETPGAGMFTRIKEKVNIPVFAMIRPRGGDFVYSPGEIDVMAEEIEIMKNAGADGFVFGILDDKNSIHQTACSELVKRAGDKPCTFHRAFDHCKDPDQSLEQIIDCGFKRILTSGMKENMDEGLDTVVRLLSKAAGRIIILPGGGLKPEHLPFLIKTGQLREIHSSCKKWNSDKLIPVFDPEIFEEFCRMMKE